MSNDATDNTEPTSSRETPDAVGRGVLGSAPDGPPTLFVLAGSALGATVIEGAGTPRWFDLRTVVSLDALGEPTAGRQHVEIGFDGEEPVEALWPEPFCDKVLTRLRELLDSGQMTPRSDVAGGVAVPSVSERPRRGPDPIEAQVVEAPAAAAFAPEAPPAPDVPPAPEPLADAGQPAVGPPSDPAAGAVAQAVAVPPAFHGGDDGEPPLPGDGPPLATAENAIGGHELVLHDVVYHGGYPGQAKRRKKCEAVLDAEGLAVSGPAGPDFRIGWDVVRTIEAQNSDEAKFRLNIKAKRNSTALVVDCDQGVTILLEARDVPTLPLRGAIANLVSGTSVVVA